MDSQDNTNSNTSNDTSANTVPTVDAPQSASFNNPAASLPPEPSAASVTDPVAATSQSQTVDVDLSDESVSVPDTTRPNNDATVTSGPVEIAFNNDPAQPSITSEAPSTPAFNQSEATSMPDSNPPEAFAAPVAAPTSEGSPVDGATPVASDVVGQPTEAVPATSPVPVHAGDKKLIVILAAIAVLLVGAILFLFLK